MTHHHVPAWRAVHRRMGSSVLPISDAVHCNRSRSALQPPLQCTASVLAVHCILHARTSHLSRKYVRPSLQVRASVLASTCNRPCNQDLKVKANNLCRLNWHKYKKRTLWAQASLALRSFARDFKQGIECGPILAHLLRRCTRLLKVLPSRQRSAM